MKQTTRALKIENPAVCADRTVVLFIGLLSLLVGLIIIGGGILG